MNNWPNPGENCRHFPTSRILKNMCQCTKKEYDIFRKMEKHYKIFDPTCSLVFEIFLKCKNNILDILFILEDLGVTKFCISSDNGGFMFFFESMGKPRNRKQKAFVDFVVHVFEFFRDTLIRFCKPMSIEGAQNYFSLPKLEVWSQ